MKEVKEQIFVDYTQKDVQDMNGNSKAPNGDIWYN